ncbi:MAG: hypothetical protein P4M00_00650 [Azospirillaceae bacterium]|nr:hypothetical protein [Azospirillaceae bacterium]
MTRRTLRGAVALACLGLAPATMAQAHGIAGDRVFPATLTIDDPAVGDELSLPTFSYKPQGQSREYDYGIEWDKTITKDLGLSFNESYTNIRQSRDLGGNASGWGDPVVTLKYQFFENDAHEILASIGVQKEFGGVGAVDHGLADATGWTQPTLYVGKGLGDLPAELGLLRPIAFTGELGYQWADQPHQLADDGTYSPNPDLWNFGFSIQYNLQYLRAQVKDYGLPDFINNTIPLVEFSYATPASPSHDGSTTTGTIAPGLLYEGNTFQLGMEALLPVNHASGNHAGMIAQVHFYLDDIFPTSLGKPLF